MEKEKIKITLKRRRTSKWGTDGQMFIDGETFCDTVEHPMRALSCGKYWIMVKFCEKMDRPVPYLIRLNRHGQPIHEEHRAHFCIGNGPLNVQDKSIIVGVSYLPGVVRSSTLVFDDLMEKIKGRRATLTIIE